MIWKHCKYCGSKEGNCLKKCKQCGNNKFWGVKMKPSSKEPTFSMECK